MGHRANFVVIREGQATAYRDQWAALGCVCTLADGPDAACQAIAEYEPTNELMGWCWAEGGYLVDFDQRNLIVFGDIVELDEFADPDGNVNEQLAAELRPFTDSGLPYLRHIAPKWRGWKLVWDDRGVDAFAAHLKQRDIASIKVQPDSHPPDTAKPTEYQA